MIGTVGGILCSEGLKLLCKEAGKQLIPVGLHGAKRFAASAAITGVGMLIGQAVEDSIKRSCIETRDLFEKVVGLEIVGEEH